MTKDIVSINLRKSLKKEMDNLDLNRSQIINDALSKYFGEGEMIKSKLERKKEKLKELRQKKQNVEQKIWDYEDEIEELNDKITERKAIKKAKEQIPDELLSKCIREVNQAKTRDRIPAAKDHETGRVVEWKPAPDTKQVLKEKANLISKKVEISEEKGRKILTQYVEIQD